MDYLRTKNIFDNGKGFKFEKILWLMEDKDFWTKSLKILRERKVYDKNVWRLSMHHKDPVTLREFILRWP